MPKRTGDFNAWRLQKLADPVEASNYLNAAREVSIDVFLAAVKDVIKAQESITAVAQKAGVTRESLHRSFSSSGNPTIDTLYSVLDVLGLEVIVTPKHEKVISHFVINAAPHALTPWISVGTVVVGGEGAYFDQVQQQYYDGPGNVRIPINRSLGGQYGRRGQTAIIQ